MSQVEESKSTSVYELSATCSSNTTSYLSVTLSNVPQNKVLLTANLPCRAGGEVKKLSEPSLLGDNDVLNVQLKGSLFSR